MGKKQQWGWNPREDSWEEAVFSWHEQVDRTFLRRRFGAEQEAVVEHLQGDYAEDDDRDVPSGTPGPEVRTPRR